MFGCPAFYIHIDNKSQCRKPSVRAWRSVFVGYASDSPVWLDYNHVSRRLVRSRIVTFDEQVVVSIAMGESLTSTDVVSTDVVGDGDNDGYDVENNADAGGLGQNGVLYFGLLIRVHIISRNYTLRRFINNTT